MKIVEYAVRPVTRYVVTRYERYTPDDKSGLGGAASRSIGEFASANDAESVADAFVVAEAAPDVTARRFYPD